APAATRLPARRPAALASARDRGAPARSLACFEQGVMVAHRSPRSESIPCGRALRVAWLLALAACDPMTSPLEQVREERIVMPVRHPFEVDLLFVIDDSPSMQQEQASLVRNMARFAQVLEQVHGGAPSLHIGV